MNLCFSCHNIEMNRRVANIAMQIVNRMTINSKFWTLWRNITIACIILVFKEDQFLASMNYQINKQSSGQYWWTISFKPMLRHGCCHWRWWIYGERQNVQLWIVGYNLLYGWIKLVLPSLIKFVNILYSRRNSVSKYSVSVLYSKL